MASTGWQKLFDAAGEAYKAGLCEQGARICRQALQLAEENRDERQRVKSLFWEGECRYQAGDIESALPLFLQVAETTSPEADPADVFNAMTKALECAIVQRPAGFVRRLLDDIWRHLERQGKEYWGHKLYSLEGDLLFAQGYFQAALQAHEKAWARYVDNYPQFTKAAHLLSLCRSCFALRDGAALAKWVEAIEASSPAIEWDRLAALLGRLLLLRSSQCRQESTDAVREIARSVLRRVDAMETVEPELQLSSLRALAVFGSHDETEARLCAVETRNDGDRFRYRLLRGDLALCRTRTHLAMEPRDDEWDEDFSQPAPPLLDTGLALRQLASAREHFESARRIGEREDERLETAHYSRIIVSRLARVDALGSVTK